MSDPKADWRTLEAGKTLDILIAQKLGLHFSIYTKPGEEPRMTEDDLADMYWNAHCILHYSKNLNAAFTLFSTELGLEWNLFSDVEGITCQLGYWINEPGRSDQLEQWNDKTAALAICKAWLAWQERTDHPAPEVKEGTE